MNESFNRLDDNESLHQVESVTMPDPLTKREAIKTIDVIGDPLLDLLKKMREDTLKLYTDIEGEREGFSSKTEGMGKGAYIKSEIALKKRLAEQKGSIVRYREQNKLFIASKKDALTTVYSNCLREKRAIESSKTLSVAQKNEKLYSIDKKYVDAKNLIAEYERIEQEVNDMLILVKYIEGVLYKRKWELAQKDPYGRYEGKKNKKKREKIKKLAEKGRERHWKNAAQYFGGSPQHEQGKCGITDMHIEKNKREMERVMEKSKENSENNKNSYDVSGINLQETGLQLPAFTEKYSLLEEEYTKLVGQEK